MHSEPVAVPLDTPVPRSSKVVSKQGRNVATPGQAKQPDADAQSVKRKGESLEQPGAKVARTATVKSAKTASNGNAANADADKPDNKRKRR